MRAFAEPPLDSFNESRQSTGKPEDIHNSPLTKNETGTFSLENTRYDRPVSIRSVDAAVTDKPNASGATKVTFTTARSSLRSLLFAKLAHSRRA